MNPWESLSALIERLLWLLHQSQRNKIQGEMIGEILAQIKILLAGLGQTPEFGLAMSALTQIGKNALQEQLEKAKLNPCETIEPAQRIREAYEAIEQAIAEINDFTNDSRFHWSPHSLWYPLEMRIPLNEIVERIGALEGHLHIASQYANLATIKALRLRDPRAVLVAQATGLLATLQDTNAHLVHIPEAPYPSEHETVKRTRELLLLFAVQLHEAVKRGRRRMERGAVDRNGEMVAPAAIAASLADINHVLWCALLTCAALARLATESQQK